MNTPKLAALALLSFAPFAAFAQASNPPTNGGAADDEIVTLKEFTVSAKAASEYAAAESTTGTRVASKILDLPFSVQSVTADFMDDFNTLEFRDQFAFTSNVVGWETLSTGYSVRGFDADVQLRNGFRRIGLIDKVNIERAEVIKGPAASIYGSVLPGGTINYVTKKPKTKAEQRLTVTAGDHDLLRGQFSSTGPLGTSKTWFYRLDTAALQRRYDQQYKEMNQATVAAQVQWRPSRDTSLLMEAEWLERRERGTSSAGVPFRIQTGTPDPYRLPAQKRTYNRYVGVAYEIIDFNTQGPHNYSNRYVKNLTATFEHRFSEVFSLRSSANWFDRGLTRQEVGGRDQFNPVTRTVPRGTPRYRPFPEGGASLQNDLLAAFSTGSVSHKLLVTVDYQRQTQQPERYDLSNFAAGMPAGVLSGMSVDAPNYDFTGYLDAPELYTPGQKEDDEIDIYGLFISERATFWNGRANLLLGGRYDWSHNISRDLLGGNVTDQKSSEITHQIGLNVRVVSGLSLYANQSTSFVPQFGLGQNADGSTYDLPNERGKGIEGGLKAGLFGEKLTFTLGWFDITRDNVATATTDSVTGRPITVLSGKQQSRGLEFDFNAVVTPSLQFFGGYGHTKAETVSNVNSPHLEGLSLRRAPENTLGIGSKYEFKKGALKGVFLTASFKYNDQSMANPSSGRSITASASNPIINNPMPNGRLPFADKPVGATITSGSVRVDDGRETVFNNAYEVVDAGIGYKWKDARKHAHRAQLNVGNVFDKRYTYGSTGQGERLSVAVTYDLTF
ncbi:TonB-dependent receptor [Opitutus sp. ER46]|uniref:TonB-dependent siderophore receptor n=1 Tax=Opitutus sp. ER46 TaxID=2161864 RepID=UPI000D301427|nr:TonB-dependent receptor [Opitutus sp. ER46]PTX96651.1 hypothetical protein DB354_08315 [Opitutus sp. ER46]